MSDMDNRAISDFMKGLLPDFFTLFQNLRRVHPGWDEREFSLNIMEFGRGQYSGVEQFRQSDVALMNHFVDSLDYDNDLNMVFAAYCAGCLLGLEQSGKIDQARLGAMLGEAVTYIKTMELQSLNE